jgi:putative DNA primase/helicase
MGDSVVQTSAPPPPPAGDDRPEDGHVFIEADNLPEVADACNQLLREKDSGVYARGDVPVGVVSDEELRHLDRPYRVVPLDPDSLAQRVNRVAVVYRRNLKSGTYAAVNLPPSIARTILAERRYAFPRLDAVAETPLILPDGELLLKPGYVRAGLLLHFDPEQFALDIDDPSPDQVDAAVGYLRELLSGFPFVDRVDETVALATLMTAVYRPGLTESPATAISARAPGSGKTTLQRLFPLIATGRDAGLVSWPDDEIELRKLLLSALLMGDGHLPIDNVNGVLRSDALCVILTSPAFTQRMLGGNEAVTVPTRTLVTVNGNNLQVAGDLVRRFLMCRLDAGVERPETRRFGFDPIERLKRERGDFVACVLTITRAYLKSGQRMDLPPFAGFDAWSRLVREPLAWAGAGDPVASVELAAQLDPDRQQLEAMVQAVRGLIGDAYFDVAHLVATARADVVEDGELRRRRHALLEAIEDLALRGGSISNRALGRWLSRVEGRIALGHRFIRRRRGDGDSERGNAGLSWRLEPAGTPR